MAAMPGNVCISRKQTFSSCHRLHNPNLSEEENKELYGKCNNPNGHGHNYTLKVTLRGPVDPQTGMVYNLSDLKHNIEETVLKQLDHKNIDKDVPYFANVVSSAENIAIYIWNTLHETITPSHLLYEVKLVETDKNSVVYRGDR